MIDKEKERIKLLKMGTSSPYLFGTLCVILVGCVLSQVNIEQNYDGYHRFEEDPDAGSKEVFKFTLIKIHLQVHYYHHNLSAKF